MTLQRGQIQDGQFGNWFSGEIMDSLDQADAAVTHGWIPLFNALTERGKDCVMLNSNDPGSGRVPHHRIPLLSRRSLCQSWLAAAATERNGWVSRQHLESTICSYAVFTSVNVILSFARSACCAAIVASCASVLDVTNERPCWDRFNLSVRR